MADRNSSRSPRTNWGNFSKNLALWLVVGLLALALFQMMSRQRNPTQEFSYTEFSKQLDQGNVARVEVFDGKRLEGDFRSPVTQDGRSAKSFQVLLPVADSEEFVKRLETSGVRIKAREQKGGFTAIIIAALPWIVIIGLWFFFLRQLQAGGSRAFAFGKSKAKLLTGDTPKVTFADVAGADEAKVELQEIIEFLKDPQKFTKLGGRLPKGALLVGPPGTGKTLLAKAVAGEAGRPFFSMSGSDFVEMFVGVGASRVRDLFEQGKAHAPCIIFIDEIDAVGRHRGAGLGGGHDEREQTLNQLLVEMDGFEMKDNIILIAATNRPDILDPALLRPGRFDRQIVVDTLAAGTPGFTGADLSNLINEAALLAARRGKKMIEQDELEEGIMRVIAGPEKKARLLSEKERKITAYHEMGHALVGHYLEHTNPVHKITIVSRGQALGLTISLPTEDRYLTTRSALMDDLAMTLGGRAAEELVFHEVTTGAANDLEKVTATAKAMIMRYGMSEKLGPRVLGRNHDQPFLGREMGNEPDYSDEIAREIDDEIRRVIEEAHDAAHRVLQEHIEELHRLSAILIERETIDKDQFERLLAGEAQRKPAPKPQPRPVPGVSMQPPEPDPT